MLAVSVMYMTVNHAGLYISYIGFWLVCISAILFTILRNGRAMVNNPRLVMPKDA